MLSPDRLLNNPAEMPASSQNSGNKSPRPSLLCAEEKVPERRSSPMMQPIFPRVEEPMELSSEPPTEAHEKRPREEDEQPQAKRVKVSEEEVAKKEEAVEAAEGQGVRLRDIPDFVANFNAIRASSPSIRKLYQILYQSNGVPSLRRSEILSWNGIPAGTSTSDLLAAVQATNCSLAELTEIGKKFLGLATGAEGKTTRGAWAEVISEVLANPQPDKIHRLAAGGRGASGGGAGGYQAWCRDHKEELKAKQPGSTHKELVRLLSETWKTVSQEEKQKYLGAPKRSSQKRSPARSVRRKKEESEEDELKSVAEEAEGLKSVEDDEEGLKIADEEEAPKQNV